MSLVNKNIRFLRQREGLTQKELAEHLKVKQPVIGAYEEERATPPLDTLLEIAAYFKINIDTLVKKDLSKIPEKQWDEMEYSRGKDVLAITVDSNEKENVELVMQKAAAGYLSGYQDPEFIEELPRINLPVLPRNHTYRAFEIRGDSMLPLPPGAIVFGAYIDKLTDISNGKPYVLVTARDGIVFKRVFNFLKNEKQLLLVSDNRQYEPYNVKAEDVLEVWEARGYFSNVFPDAPGATDTVAEQLALQVVKLAKAPRPSKKG